MWITECVRLRITFPPAYAAPRYIPAVKPSIGSSSPFRVYTNALLTEVLLRYWSEKGTVLDVGCGKGGYSQYFESDESNYIGLDVNRSAQWISWMNEHYRRSFVLGSAEALPFHPNCIDFSVSSSALEHMADDEKAAESLVEIMKPGSYSIHIVPSVWSLFLYAYHGYRRYSPEILGQVFLQPVLKSSKHGNSVACHHFCSI